MEPVSRKESEKKRKMADSSKDLLHLESNNPTLTAIESKLLVCGKKHLGQGENQKPKPAEGAPLTSPIPNSQVVGKVKDFLGVISEANRRLANDAKDNVKDYDIEVLTGNEPEYIEMDLMLGVADLHTPEAVSAAESAIAGRQPVISLASAESDIESEDSDDDSSDDDDDDDDDPDTDDDNDNDSDDDDDDDDDSDDDDDDDDSDDDVDDENHKAATRKGSQFSKFKLSGEMPGKRKSKKRPKIIELS